MSSLSKTPQTLGIVLLGTLGLLAGIILLNFDARDNPCSKSFVETPQFSVWSCLVSFETALWSIFSVSLWQRLQQFRSHLEKNWLEILLITFLITFLSLFALASTFADKLNVPLYGFWWKTHLLTATGFILALMAGSGIWLAQIALKTSVFREGFSDNQKIRGFLDLRDTLQNFLFTAGTIIGAATLATGALRQATLTWYSTAVVPANCKETGVPDFPPEMVLLYGAYLSAILALTYLPTHGTLAAVGQRLCDELLPMPNFQDAEWGAWVTKRKSLEEMLKLNLTVKQSFETGVAIFAPLVASSISLLLGKT
ncbi:MAG TPA: hypothetical protein V6D10_17670 [Trichocoleus sp.]